MEKLILVTIVTLCSIQTSFLSFNAQPSGGVITMEDMILSVTLDNPLDKIEGINIYNAANESILDASGCYQNDCTYSLQGVASGTYEVFVNVQNGTDFSGYITVQ